MFDKLLLVSMVSAGVIGLSGGLVIGNVVRKDYLNEQAQATLSYCEKDDEVVDCRIEWQYEGLILIGFEVVGQGV